MMNSQYVVETVGNSQTPVLVIDNFLPQLPQLLAAAKQGQFHGDQHSFYPGVRCMLPRAYVISALQAIYRPLYQLYQIPADKQLKPLDTYFSLISKQPNELAPMQRLPHFDTARPYYFAFLHYLNPGPHGNTGLFRHKSSRRERIFAADVEPYLATLQHELAAQPTNEGYCDEQSPHFDCYHQLEYKQNRVVIYPGNLLHSTLVEQQDISTDLTTGRLTANIFFEFQ